MKSLRSAKLRKDSSPIRVLIDDTLKRRVPRSSPWNVRFDGKDRDEVYRRAVQIRPRIFAIVIYGQYAEEYGNRALNFSFDPHAV